MKAAALVVVLVGCLVPVGAQFRSRVDSVTLDVLVTERGRPIAGLTAVDFEVRDDGIPQEVRLVASGSLPVDVILALDMSGSLSAEQMTVLRSAGDALLDRLRAGDRAGLLTFSHVVRRREPLTHDLALVRNAIGEAQPAGFTSLTDALFAGLAMAEPGDRRTLLIALSDGVDTASWLRPEAAEESARRSEAVVYAVSTSEQRGSAPVLAQIASATGGKVLDADSRRLGDAFVRILEEFRQRYLLSYTLPGTPASGWHRIDVRVKRRGAQVKARSGYLVQPR